MELLSIFKDLFCFNSTKVVDDEVHVEEINQCKHEFGRVRFTKEGHEQTCKKCGYIKFTPRKKH